MVKLAALAALFAAGLLLAGTLAPGGAADVTTTETLPTTETTTLEETTTAPATTVITTVEHTTTESATTPTGTTTSSSTSSTPTWVWVVLAILAAAVIGLLAAFFARRGAGISADERQRRLDAAVATWAAQGWALVNQSAGTATMRHGPDLMVVTVDDAGQVDARPLASS